MIRTPTDSPVWLDRAIIQLREKLQGQIRRAQTGDEALIACGAFATLLDLENTCEVEAADEAANIRAQRERMAGGRQESGN